MFTAARNKATDRFRAQKTRQRVHANLALEAESSVDQLEKTLEDDLLRLIFTCCHPALAEEVRVPLTLKSVTGLSLQEVSRAFLVPTKTMEQRLLRAKKKILEAGIAYEVPAGKQLEPRLDSVMQTLYLLFNEGYQATSGDNLIKTDLCSEAIRLTTIVQRLFPQRAELMALLALLLFQDSRRNARVSATGDLIALDQQDRSLWQRKQILQASAILDKALLLRQPPGAYQIQAAIAALHCQANEPSETDWQQIVLLYERLLELAYTEVVHLNYAVSIAMTGDVTRALKELAVIASQLSKYFPFYCARADFHARLGDTHASRKDYEVALTLTNNFSEQRFVSLKIDKLSE